MLAEAPLIRAALEAHLELFRSSLYIAFSRDSDDALVANWARALELLRETGELERIRDRYR